MTDALLPSTMTSELDFITEIPNFNFTSSLPPFVYSEQQPNVSMVMFSHEVNNINPVEPWAARTWTAGPLDSETSAEQNVSTFDFV